MFALLLVLREYLSSTLDNRVDYSDSDTLKQLSPENCHICNYDDDMSTLSMREYLEKHREFHSQCYSNENRKFKI